MGGGYKIVGPDGNVSDWTSEHVLFSLDLSTTFPVETLLSPDFLHNTSIPLDIVPSMLSQTESNWAGALFASNDSIYVYGGGDLSGAAENILASYNVTTSTWNSVTVSGGDFENNPRLFGQSVSIPASGLAFFVGGTDGVQGMLRFDESDSSRISWTNQTLGSGSSGISVPDSVAGGMVYLPVGKGGVLLLLGGSNAALWPTLEMLSMANIAVYDIDSSSWYLVTATGTPDIPNGRTEFCLGVSRAPDDSSFQVTLYGGTLENETYYDDVWVLSVPSFLWIRVQDTNNQELISNGPGAGRKGHTCAMWEDSQMIVLGGIYAVNAATKPQGQHNFSVCDTLYSSIRLLDTSTYSWKNEYTPNNTYIVPLLVSAVIGGDASGKANLTMPRGGWNDSSLADIFSQVLPRINTTPSHSTSSQSAPSKPSSTSSTQWPATTPSSHTSNGLIGGIVGGAIAVVLVISMIVLTLWRRKRMQKPMAISNPPATRTSSYRKPELADNGILELPDTELRNVHELAICSPPHRAELPGHYEGYELATGSH